MALCQFAAGYLYNSLSLSLSLAYMFLLMFFNVAFEVHADFGRCSRESLFREKPYSKVQFKCSFSVRVLPVKLYPEFLFFREPTNSGLCYCYCFVSIGLLSS